LGILRSRPRLLWVYKIFPRECGNSTSLSTPSLHTHTFAIPRCGPPFFSTPLSQTP